MSLLALYLYPLSLALISVVVAVLEHFFPWRKEQKQLRGTLLSDFLHLVFNGHFLGVILYGIAATHLLPHLDHALAQAGLTTWVYRNLASGWPVAVQIVVALLVVDFLQWGVHNLLHRVGFLWETHKVHHSVVDGEMDWIVSFRFQWTEVVVYRALLYVPLAFLGFSSTAVMVHAIFGTLIGHLNHANLDLGHGWWRYILNSPRMHIWHHNYDGDARTTVNFGIIFSLWDWIFGTASMPDQPPPRLGFAGVETFPKSFFAQEAWPLTRLLPSTRWGTLTASAVGAGVLVLGWVLHQPPVREVRTPLLGEQAASSQPSAASTVTPDAYAFSVDDATAALGSFGNDAKAAGYGRPDVMVSVRELARALGSPRLVLLDVRPRKRFEEGHIPSAQPLWRDDYSTEAPIPGLSRPRDELERALRARGVSSESVVVLYTDGGPEAHRLWWTLREVAGREVRILDGGLLAWKEAGHGLAGGVPRASTEGNVVLSAPLQPPRLTWSELASFRASGVTFVDTRSRDEFDGRKQHDEAGRAGHIPDAVHLEWVHVFKRSNGTLRAPDELRALFREHGLSADSRVMTYCQSGTRSAAVYFALMQTGVSTEQLVNYDGSWAEYSRLDLAAATDSPPAATQR
ncbi:MAG: rhodanese-like domain-containing protein [Myxococcota bacterium]